MSSDSAREETDMAMKDSGDTLLVLGASYDGRDQAEMDYQALEDLHNRVGSAQDFDAAVVERQEDGNVRVIEKHGASMEHSQAMRPEWGVAVGAVSASLLPISAGGLIVGADAAIDSINTVTGQIRDGMDNDDLRKLGQVLDEGDYALVAVYEGNMADQVNQTVQAANRYVLSDMKTTADELAKQIQQQSESKKSR
jgi:uncharacterized membrane protein